MSIVISGARMPTNRTRTCFDFQNPLRLPCRQAPPTAALLPIDLTSSSTRTKRANHRPPKRRRHCRHLKQQCRTGAIQGYYCPKIRGNVRFQTYQCRPVNVESKRIPYRRRNRTSVIAPISNVAQLLTPRLNSIAANILLLPVLSIAVAATNTILPSIGLNPSI
jgi:hypothetical protein